MEFSRSTIHSVPLYTCYCVKAAETGDLSTIQTCKHHDIYYTVPVMANDYFLMVATSKGVAFNQVV